MIMVGSLIGAIIGFKFGGFFGMIFGGYLGGQAETFVSEKLLGKPSRQEQVQEAYFEALFVTLGKLAKADGVITKNEIRKCEAIMNHMQLDAQRKKEAIKLFSLGKEDNVNINRYLARFMKASHGAYSMKQVFLEMLIEVASAENKINQAEMNFMYSIADKIRFPRQIFVTLIRMRGFNVNGQSTGQRRQQQQHSHYNSNRNQHQRQNQNQQQWQRASITSPYQTLGVSKTDSKAVIRKAYKKLMSVNHPDKLIAKGLPPDMVRIAKEKTQNIQAAWEEVKDLRGF